VGSFERFQLEVWEAAITENIGVFLPPPVPKTDGLLQPNGDLRCPDFTDSSQSQPPLRAAFRIVVR
jgi:hypothetical protein